MRRNGELTAMPGGLDDLKRRIEARIERVEVLRGANPWTASACPLECWGAYPGVDPGTGDDVEVPCQHHDSPRCPRLAPREITLEEALRRCGIGTEYLHPNPERVAPRAILDAYANNWRKQAGQGHGLFICGGIGTGKSYALTYLVARLLEQGLRYSAVSVQIAGRLFDTLHREPDAVDRFAEVPLLVIDDLGAQYSADWNTARFELLVEDRYRERRPLVVTSNFSIDEIAAGGQFPRASDRIRQRCREVVILGPSQRDPVGPRLVVRAGGAP